MIGYWIFCLSMDLLTPVMMIVFGWLFLKKPPKTINHVYGYRTSRSMKNQQTWDFAHKTCGRIWFRGGIVLTILSVPPMLIVLGRGVSTIGIICSVVVGVQIIVMFVTLFPVERALKQNFDQYGRKLKK